MPRTIVSFRPSRCRLPSKLALATVVGAAMLFGSLQQARAERLLVSAGVPLVVPLGMNQNIGAGFTPGIQLNVAGDFGFELVSGFIYYRNDDQEMELDVPLLAGINWSFGEGRLRPFVTVKLGYTYAPDAEKSSHWITGVAGIGARVGLSQDFKLDLGLEMLIPDFRGKANEPVGMLFKISARYALL